MYLPKSLNLMDAIKSRLKVAPNSVAQYCGHELHDWGNDHEIIYYVHTCVCIKVWTLKRWSYVYSLLPRLSKVWELTTILQILRSYKIIIVVVDLMWPASPFFISCCSMGGARSSGSQTGLTIIIQSSDNCYRSTPCPRKLMLSFYTGSLSHHVWESWQKWPS